MDTKEIAHFESLYPADSRYKELEKIIAYVKQGQSVQAVGLPGVGQSTLLKLLSYSKNIRKKHLGHDFEKFHFVLINFFEAKNRSLSDVTKLMFLSLMDSLRERGMHEEYEKANSLFKESALLSDEMVMFQGLKQALDMLTLEKSFNIVFLLDRFEEYVPMLTNDFFTNLSVIRNRAKHKFSIIVALSRPLDEVIDASLVSGYKEYLSENIVYLSIIEEPILNFSIKQMEDLYGRKLDTSLKDKILTITGGFGRLAKNCVQFVLNNRTIEQLNNEGLSDLFLSQPSIQAPLMDIWNALTPSEQDFLLSNTDYSSSDADYPHLSNVGLLRDGKIAIPLFEAYLRNTIKDIEKKTENDPIKYLSEKDEIRQGNDVISDRLTRSEFKLLRFLIEKQNSVVDREMIISAVWTDTASLAGVSDQALDQLLLRLRRKIEDDPNNPIHVQTVKGRGIKFTP